jgi:rhodanese-related sulfurtransferase
MKKTNSSLLNYFVGAALLIGTAAQAAVADGNWSWITAGRNGGTPRETVLSLKTDGAKLTGKISTPGADGKPVDTQIADGKVAGNTISFTALRIFNGNTNKVSYTGTVADGQITGKIETVRNGEVQSRDWLAKNAGSKSEAAAVEVVQPKPGYDAQGHKIVNETHYKEISPLEAQKFLSEHPDAIILDLRPPADYAAGHLPNAKNCDLTDDIKYKDVIATITDKTKWYLVHSVVGHFRTVRALEYFEANGFEHAVAIDGGYAAWVKAGLPTVK